MSGYRFCRTDDVPLLVEAYNSCYRAHFPDEAPMTVADFKRDVRELNLWASSCMVALAGDEPIGVLLSAKRETVSLIYRIGVRPEHQRQGHGQHLLKSLSRKLGILGPPTLTAEIPGRWSSIRGFFEDCGYRAEVQYADFVLDESRPTARAVGAIVPVTLEEIVESGAYDQSVRRSWERSLSTLVNRARQLEGVAVISDLRIEAYLLHRPNPTTGDGEIVALGCAPGEQGTGLLGILVHHLCHARPGRVSVPKVSEQEVGSSLLESWGFRRAEEYVGYAALATTG